MRRLFTASLFLALGLITAAGCGGGGGGDGPSTTYTYYRDSDGDNYGSNSTANAINTTASAPPTGYVVDNTDCNDADAAVYPGATELFDSIDNDCDGTNNEGYSTYFQDSDADGYGTAANTTVATSAPAGYVANSTDCDDANAAINPGATEIFDSIDNNCNVTVDENFATYYQDSDGDTYGNQSVSVNVTSAPAGYVTNNTDCDDANAAINPGATEIVGNLLDDNCDGTPDESAAPVYASVSGFLKDRSGAPIGGATVYLQEPGTVARIAPLPRAGSKYTQTALINAARAQILSDRSPSRAARLARLSIDSTVTDSTTGFYSFDNVLIPADGKVLVSFEKSGYASYQELVTLNGNLTSTVDANLAEASVTPATGVDTGDVVIGVNNTSSSAGMNLLIPAGSILDAAGNPVTGDVNVEVAVADPTLSEDRDIFPGSYAAAATGEDLNNPATTLESVAFAEITIRDASGTEYTQLDENNPAIVQFLLPEGVQNGTTLNPETNAPYVVGNTMPWWSYNEDMGVWQQEDADPTTTDVIDDATVVTGNDGKLYVEAKVVHFTWWNGDWPTTRAYLNINVIDGDGNPVIGAQVSANGVSYNTNARVVVTDGYGKANGIVVKGSVDGQTPETCQVLILYNGVEFLQNIINTPLQTQTATYTYTVSLPGTISGTVRDYNGTPLSGIWVHTNLYGSKKTDASGNYSFSVMHDEPVLITVNGATTPTITATTTTATPDVTGQDFQFPEASFALALSLLEGDDTTPGNPKAAYDILAQMAAMGTLDNNGKLLWSILSLMNLADQAATDGTELNNILDSVGIVVFKDEVSGDYRATSVTETCLTYDMMGACTELNPYYDEFFVMTGSPQVATAAQILKNKITASEGVLAQIDGPVSFTIGGSEVDSSEVKLVGGAFKLVKFMLSYVESYQILIREYAANGDQRIGPPNLQDILLSSGAATTLAESKANLFGAVTSFEEYIAAMQVETDTQYDDLIYLDGQFLAQLTFLDDMIAGFKASANGMTDVPFYDFRDSRITAANMNTDGTFDISEEQDKFLGTLRINIGSLFTPEGAFDGAKLTADLNSGAAVMTPLYDLYSMDQSHPDSFSLTFTSASHLATVVKGVFGSAEFVNRTSYYTDYFTGNVTARVDTEEIIPFLDSTGAPVYRYEQRYHEANMTTTVEKVACGLTQTLTDENGVNSTVYPFDTGENISWTENRRVAVRTQWGEAWGSQPDQRPFEGRFSMTFSYLYGFSSIIRTPLAVGATWTEDVPLTQYPTSMAGSSGITAVSTIEGLGETVVTPAGTFTGCIKVVTVISGSGNMWGTPLTAEENEFITGTRTVWYGTRNDATGFNGGIVKMTYQHDATHTTVSELTGYVDGTGTQWSGYKLFNVVEGTEYTYSLTNPYADGVTVPASTTETCMVPTSDIGWQSSYNNLYNAPGVINPYGQVEMGTVFMCNGGTEMSPMQGQFSIIMTEHFDEGPNDNVGGGGSTPVPARNAP